MSGGVLIGIGNAFRRDDGVGLAVAEEIGKIGVPGVQVVTAIGEPAAILDVWDGARLAVVVDAAFGDSSRPGIVRRWTPGDETTANMVSSHAFGLPQTYALGSALGRLPQKLVGFTIDVADVSLGVGLTPAVAAAIPALITAVVAEF